jgi:putative drug exporter of the RND superfamily
VSNLRRVGTPPVLLHQGGSVRLGAVAILSVTRGPLTGRQIELDRELVLGREHTEADVVIDDVEVSRRHLLVRPAGSTVELEDLGSTNGTFVNDHRIGERTRVGNGAVVRLGTTEFTVQGLAVSPTVISPTRLVDGPVADPDATRVRQRPPVAMPEPPPMATPGPPPPPAPSPPAEPTRAPRALDRVVGIVTGRRTKYVLFIVWFAALAALAQDSFKFTNVQKSDPADYLPPSAEATKATDEAVRFPSGRLSPASIIYRRSTGLTSADRTLISSERTSTSSIKGVGSVDATKFSSDKTSALVVARLSPAAPGILTAAKDIRKLVDHNTGGLSVAVTGPAGFTTDSSNVFGSIDKTLFIATFVLVLVLLVLIYRSPFFWIVPLTAIVLAVIIGRGIGYLLAKHGVITITGQSGGIMAVLVFGVGTDYSLLLIARYRRALSHQSDSHLAAAQAMREAAPAILPSSLTVIAGLLCLELAENKSTSGLGAIGAAGVAVAMLAMLTLLPALLAAFGRRLFWPFVPQPEAIEAERAGSTWERVAMRVAAAPRPTWLIAFLLLAVMAVGLVDLNSRLTAANGFRNTVEAVTGQKLVAKAFPPGVSSPAYVIVNDLNKASAVRTAISNDRRVASVGPLETSGGAALFEVDLANDPYGEAGFNDIKSVRSVASRTSGGKTLVGGDTANELDLRTAQSRDNLLIIPLVLVLVLVILTILLRAVVASLLLISTVVASFAATLGLASVAFGHVFNFAGLDPSLPLLSFALLVSLGVDYNIFLMTRVREETRTRGTRDGMIRGLAVTGGVITSAGIVLAGTFCMLALLPLVVLTEVGLTIAFGALLDTFIVRSLLVPALVLDIGPRTWWPSWLARQERAPAR